MIYVDDLVDYGPKGVRCHCWTDGPESELMTFAQGRLEIPLSWVHRSKGSIGDFTHFDLSPHYRRNALRAGATYLALKDWIIRRRAELQEQSHD